MLNSKVLLSIHDLQKSWRYLSVIMQSFDALVRFTNLQLFFTPSCTYIFWKWPWHFVLPHSLLNHYRRLWFYSPPRWRQHDIPTQIVAWCTIGFVPIHAMQYLKYNYLLPPAMICLDMTRHNTRHSPPLIHFLPSCTCSCTPWGVRMPLSVLVKPTAVDTQSSNRPEPLSESHHRTYLLLYHTSFGSFSRMRGEGDTKPSPPLESKKKVGMDI